MGGGQTAGQEQSTPEMKANLQLANSRMADYQNRFVPLQNYYINRTEGDVSNNTSRAVGQAEGGAKASVGAQADSLEAGQTASGAGPGSGRSIMGLDSLNNKTATTAGLGATTGQQAVQSQFVSGLGAIAGMGEQQANMAEGQTEDAAKNSMGEEDAQTQGNLMVANQRDADTTGAITTGLSATGGYLATPNPTASPTATSPIPYIGGEGMGMSPGFSNAMDSNIASGASPNTYAAMPGLGIQQPGAM